MNFGKAVFLEKHGHLLAAAAVMADRDHLASGVELAEPPRNLPHGNVARAFEARGLPFPRLAHVEQLRLFTARVGEPGRELPRSDLVHVRNGSATAARRSPAGR